MSDFYTFTRLKSTVEEAFGFVIKPGGRPVNVEQKIVRLESHDFEKIIFRDGNVYLKDGETEFRGFLIKEENYVEAYYDKELGYASHLPKFHTTLCDTLNKMRLKKRFDGVYIFSNEVLLRQEAKESGGMMSDCRICILCMKMSNNIDKVIFTKDFVNDYLTAEYQSKGFTMDEIPKRFKKDPYGYVHGWKDISVLYRKSKGFRCENCGIDLSDNKYYLETHHIIPNRTLNDFSNLRSLCVCCHSKVDEYHKKNYSKGRSKNKLNSFIQLYGECG